MTKTRTMIITFEGESHQIDANTLVSVLSHYNSIIALANQEYGNGNRNVHLSVNALEKGSFNILLSLGEGLKTIFSSDSIKYLTELAGLIAALFKTYKIFKGRPVKTEEDKKKVEGLGNTNVTTIINIYNQPIVREAVSKSFERANEDSNVSGLKIQADDKEPISFPKEEFPELIYKEFDKEDIPEEKAEFVDTYLSITALSFNSGGNWKFLYQGFQISMSVKDDALMKAIDNGMRFGKGDTLRVRLKINKRYDTQLCGWVNISYRIEEFYEHIPAPQQGELYE